MHDENWWRGQAERIDLFYVAVMLTLVLIVVVLFSIGTSCKPYWWRWWWRFHWWCGEYGSCWRWFLCSEAAVRPSLRLPTPWHTVFLEAVSKEEGRHTWWWHGVDVVYFWNSFWSIETAVTCNICWHSKTAPCIKLSHNQCDGMQSMFI